MSMGYYKDWRYYTRLWVERVLFVVAYVAVAYWFWGQMLDNI